MKATKLTPKQRELFESLKLHEGGVLRQHIKMSNTVCFRLLDKDRNPIKNYSYSIVHALIDKDVIEVNKSHDYVLKATIDLKADISKLGIVNHFENSYEH